MEEHFLLDLYFEYHVVIFIFVFVCCPLKAVFAEC